MKRLLLCLVLLNLPIFLWGQDQSIKINFPETCVAEPVEADGDGDGIPNESTEIDTDMDGINDFEDEDDDGDGISTLAEITAADGTITIVDTDGNGIPDYLDEDDDGDGVPSNLEIAKDEEGNPILDDDDRPVFVDTDGDGISNDKDDDDDNDGIPTLLEITMDADGNPIFTDTDEDGVPDYLENTTTNTDVFHATNKDELTNDKDSDDDGDGIPTIEEIEFDADGNLILDFKDTDEDGIPDYLDSANDVATESDCENGIDDDGDGLVDCDDLDCFESIYTLHSTSSSRSSACPDLSNEEISCVLQFKENLERIGIISREKAVAFCNNGYEEIIVIGEGLVDNSTFNCLLTTLLFNNGQESLFDNTIRKFQYAFPANLHFDSIDNHPDRCSGADGCIEPDFDNKKITIYLDPNQDAIDMAGTILHEGIHASIMAYLNNLGVDVKLLNIERLHQLYALERYNKNSIDHFYMTETYITPIASALRQLSGNEYPVDHYYGFAWDGLRYFYTDDSQTDPDEYNQYKSIVRENFNLCD